jgi:hypothetical protein
MKFTLLLLASLAASAQSPSPKANWANLKSLTVGGEIRVSLQDGQSFRGQMQSVTDDSLVMIAASSQQSLTRTQVAKVSTKGESHRRRNTLIGLGIGAGGGVAVGAGIDQGCKSNCWFGNNIGKEVFTPIGAIIGTIVGVAWPTGTWHEVYRAK